LELKEYILPLRRWWWLIVASTLVATGASFLATRQQAPIYQTHTTLMVGRAIDNPNPSNNDLWLTQQLANTYTDLAQRDFVRNAAMEALGLTWLPEYTVRVVPNTQLIEMTVVDTSPERVQAVANELANQLILQTPTGANPEQEQRQAFINQQLGELEQDIQATKDEITRKQEDLAGMFSARQIANAQTQIQGLQNKLNTLQANYAALLSNTEQGAINTIRVIENAALPEIPVGPNKELTILLAAVIGFILAAGAAYLLEYLDDTIKNPDDVRKELALTTLGAIPAVDSLTADEELIALREGQSPAKEGYRVLRTNLQFAAVDEPITQLMITSPSPREGKSITTANLAAAQAQAGKQVIVVDADLHRPRQHRLFKLANNVGLTTALLEERPNPDGLLQQTAVPGLRVLTSGPLPPNPAELLGSSRMHDLLDRLQEQADIVVLDSPPATMLADAAILSTFIDGVLLVIDSGKTRQDVAKRAVEALKQVNARLVGVLLNRMPTRGSGYYYYYYYYKQGYYSSDDDQQRGGRGGLFRSGKKRKRGRRRTPTQVPVSSQPAKSSIDI
jgi:capsular exopolysaccharide synthesis family protein